MKYRILHNNPIEFYDTNASLVGSISANGTNLKISSVNGIIELGNTATDVQVGTTGTSINWSFMGGGTIGAAGVGNINIGQSGDTVNMNVASVNYNWPAKFLQYNQVTGVNNKIDITTSVPGSVILTLPNRPVVGQLALTDSISAVDNNSGTLVVSGGMGVQGNVFMSSSNNWSTGATNANAGYRLGWQDNYFYRSPVYNGVYFSGNFLSMQSGTFYIESAAGLVSRGNIYNDNAPYFVKIGQTSGLNIQNTAPSTSNSTGALLVAGGVGIAGNVYVSSSASLGSNASFGATNLSTISLQGQLQPYTVYGTDGPATNTVLTLPDVNWAINAVKGGVIRNVLSRNTAGDINIGQNYTAYVGSIQLNAGAATTSQIKFVTGSQGQYLSNFDTFGNLNVANNVTTNGRINVTFAPPTAVNSAIEIAAANTIGGIGYSDFLKATNTSAGATTPNKFFRLDSSGTLQILNSAYTSVVMQVTDAGGVSIAGSSSTNNDPTTNWLSFNNNQTAIYDDGNTHIHNRAANQSIWINTNGGDLRLLQQSTVNGGSVGNSIIMGGSQSSSATAYLNVLGSKSYAISGYGYLTGSGAGTVAGSSGTVAYGIYCANRIQSGEVDVLSDERTKEIQGIIPLDKALSFVRGVDGILYNWKEGFGDEGLKSGFSAQGVHKAGFDHMIGHIPNEQLTGDVDDDGWTHPDKMQLTMGYNQVIPYHHEVIKHLLDKIEQMEKIIEELKGSK